MIAILPLGVPPPFLTSHGTLPLKGDFPVALSNAIVNPDSARAIRRSLVEYTKSVLQSEWRAQRLIDIAREAGEHRDERITKSLTRIPPTLMGFVNALSTALLVLVFVY